MRHRGLLAQLPLSLRIPQDLWNLSEKGPPCHVHLPVNTPTTPQHSPVTPGGAAEESGILPPSWAPFLSCGLLGWGSVTCRQTSAFHLSEDTCHGEGAGEGEGVCDKPMESTSGGVWPWDEFQFSDFPGRKQGPFEAFSF